MKNALSITGLTIEIEGRPVVDAVDVQTGSGEMLALVGASGSGKSMTALAAMGLLPAAARISAGDITASGKEVTNASPEELRRLRGGTIGMIFQEPLSSLNPVMSIGDQLKEGLVAIDGVSGSEARNRCLSALKDVHIDDPERVFAAFPHQLSGGMRQRAMIAMALLRNPAILLADEPTTALDVTVQARIVEILKEQQTQRNLAILFITHDIALAAGIADRIAVMHEGRIVEAGKTEAVISEPQSIYARGLITEAKDRQAWQTRPAG